MVVVADVRLYCAYMASMGITCIVSICLWRYRFLRRHAAPFRPDSREACDCTKDSCPHLRGVSWTSIPGYEAGDSPRLTMRRWGVTSGS